MAESVDDAGHGPGWFAAAPPTLTWNRARAADAVG